jgi:hypothetical protein
VILVPLELFQIPEFQNFRLLMNLSMSEKIGGFHIIPHETRSNCDILLYKPKLLQTLTIGLSNKQYVVLTEKYQSSHVFPFNKIVFRTTNLPIEKLKSHRSDSANQDERDTILLNFHLSVSELEKFYDDMVYQPESLDRKVSLKPNQVHNLRQVHIKPMLETPDGHRIPIYVKPRNSCEIYLQLERID